MKLHRRPQSVDRLFEPLEARALLGGDHPSLGDFPDATEIIMVDNPGNQSSIGIEYGEIEVEGDDDLFKFEAPYSMPAAIVVAQTSVGGLAPAIQLFDDTGTALTSVFDAPNGVAMIFPIPITYLVQGEVYYINIKAGTPSNSNEPNIVGEYMVNIVMTLPPSPSHAAPGEDPSTPTEDVGAAPAPANPDAELYTFGLPSVAGDFGSLVTVKTRGVADVAGDAIAASFVTPVRALTAPQSLDADLGVTQVSSSSLRADRVARVNVSLVQDDVLSTGWTNLVTLSN